MKASFPVHLLRHGDRHVALAGVRLERILSAELFASSLVRSGGLAGALDLASACARRFADLASSLARLPIARELYVLVGARDRADGSRACETLFLCAERADDVAVASAAARSAADDVSALLSAVLDYAEFAPVLDSRALSVAASFLRLPSLTEVRRRRSTLALGRGFLGSTEPVEHGGPLSEELSHLFPWTPSSCSWRRLLEAVAAERGAASFVAHLKGLHGAPEPAREEARVALAASERILVPSQVETVPSLQADVLRGEALFRVAVLEGPVVAARVFLAGSASPSGPLLSTLLGAVDGSSERETRLFRGGARVERAAPRDVLDDLDASDMDVLFAPTEAASFLRTPLPSDHEYPGVEIRRARTAPPTGRSGNDAPLGTTVAGGRVRLDAEVRSRHTYVVGQTGTGKSTLLLRMALADIERGHGVAVLDPHGPLVEGILSRIPRHRRDDVVVVDPTDVERPVGLNPLRIGETDPLAYRLARDLVIDDLFAFFDRTWDMKACGGPMFELYFRGVMALLLGLDEQRPPLVPNVLAFRSVFTNKALRDALVARVKDRDPAIADFVAEVERVAGEASLQNVSPYVTSKLNRFASDLLLRNVLCRADVLDVGEVVDRRRILLVCLGRGRLGDHAAGLLASHVASLLRRAVMRRDAGPARTPFHLYADEFQLFADARFAELMSEARKFGLTLTVAHQYLAQLPANVLESVQGNAGTVVALRVGATDAERLEPIFRPTFAARDLSSLPNHHAYVRSNGQLGLTPFGVALEAPDDPGDPTLAAVLRRESRARYGRDRAAVEADITATQHAYASFRGP